MLLVGSLKILDLSLCRTSKVFFFFLETNSQENINTSVSDIMGEHFTQLDFSQIAGQPHRLPDKAVEKLPMYTGTDATTFAMHLRSFSRCISSYVSDPANKHDDVYMKLFALSLDGRAGDWYTNLLDNAFATLELSRLLSLTSLVKRRNLGINWLL